MPTYQVSPFSSPVEEPVDKYNFVYTVLFIHGIGTLLPWNMFITANDYFINKLTVVNSTNETGVDGGEVELVPSVYRDNFLTWVGIASKFPNVIIQLINFIVGGKSRALTNRILISILLEAAIFALTTGLAIADSSQWIPLFFWITMASVVVINIWNGVYQNCIYGAIAVLPPKYLNAVVAGMNCSGVLSAVIMVLAIAATPDIQMSAVIYFSIAVAFLLLCFGTYLFLLRNAFFVHHAFQDGKEDGSNGKPSLTMTGQNKLKSYIDIIRRVWMQLFNIFFTYFVTLAVFPAVTATVKSPSGLLDRFFSAVFCFLSFNLFAMIGNLIVDYVPRIPPRYLCILTIARVVFIPFFLFCNSMPDTRSVAYVFGDGAYIVGIALFALTCGYVSSLAMIYAPQLVSQEQASSAGMLASFTLMVGIMAGIFSSIIWTHVV